MAEAQPVEHGELHAVDVLADAPLSGNGLVAVLGAGGLEHDQMLRVTQEMRQFETIFLDRPSPGRACGHASSRWTRSSRSPATPCSGLLP